METALRLFDEERGLEGGYELVTAPDLRAMGKERATKLAFICRHHGCNIRVYPVFPEVERNGKVPECYFRASAAELHKGHGTQNKSAQTPASSPDGNGDGRVSGWRDPRPKSESIAAKTGAGAHPGGEGDPEGQRPRSGNAGEDKDRFKLTTLLWKLVAEWESRQPEILATMIDFPGRKGETWGDVFLLVGSPLSSRELDGGRRCVFYGTISEVQPYGKEAFNICFAERIDGKSVSCYFDFFLHEQKNNPVQTRLLKQQRKGGSGRVYVLGMLRKRQGGCRIEVKSHRHVWISV